MRSVRGSNDATTVRTAGMAVAVDVVATIKEGVGELRI
jgi:hypothetical protein